MIRWSDIIRCIQRHTKYKQTIPTGGERETEGDKEGGLSSRSAAGGGEMMLIYLMSQYSSEVKESSVQSAHLILDVNDIPVN